MLKEIQHQAVSSTKTTRLPEIRFSTALPREYFVDAAEAAKFLGLNHRTLMKMAREGSVPAHPIGDGARKLWRFLLSELDEWLRARINSACRPCSPNRRNAQ